MKKEKKFSEGKITNENYTELFKNMTDGFAYCKVIYDAKSHPVDFVYLDVNKMFSKLTGLKNVTGKKVSEVIPHILKKNPELMRLYGNVAVTGKSREFETRIKILGKNLFLKVSVYSPKKGFFVATFNDISKIQKESILHNEYPESIMETLTEPLIVLNKDLRVVSANSAFYKTFKVNEKETENNLIYNLGNKQWDIPKLRELLERILLKKKVFKGFLVEHEFQKIGKRIMLLNARNIDSLQLILLAIDDITNLKKREQIVDEMTNKFRTTSIYARSLLEASIDPLVTINLKGKITDANQAAAKTRGVSKKELIGMDFSRLFVESKQARNLYKQAFDKERISDYQLTMRSKDGRLINLIYNASVYRDSKGKVVGVFTAARDITQLKLAEEESQKHIEELEKMNNVMIGRELKMVELKRQIEMQAKLLAQK